MIPVGSVFYNLQTVVPPGLHHLLGARWSFDEPDGPLTEYTLPRGYTELLNQRAGIVLRCGDDDTTLHAHLCADRKAIVAVDSYHLPYRPAFNRVHSGRTVVLWRRADGALMVDDPWLPARHGPVEAAALDRARSSEVPRVHALEPVFAGHPVGRWWMVAETAGAYRAPAVTVGELASDMLSAETACRRLVADVKRDLGRLPAATGVEGCRRAVLSLRCELGLRPFLAALLNRMLADEPLARAHVSLWSQAVGRGAFGGDLLTKSIGRRSGEWGSLIVGELCAWLDAEIRLATLLSELRL